MFYFSNCTYDRQHITDRELNASVYMYVIGQKDKLFQGENGRVRSYLVRNANEAEKQEKLCKNRVCLFSVLPYLVEKLITREHVNRRKISSECLF